MSAWTIVLRGDWYLPHLVNMLRDYYGNGEQNLCRDEVIEQIRAQMIRQDGIETSRPLVILDPEDREQVDRLCRSLVECMHAAGDERSAANGVHPATVAAALARLIEPKPKEPTGWLSVVRDCAGELWVRTGWDGGMGKPWQRQSVHRHWDAFDWVEVVSEGNESFRPVNEATQ